MLRKAASLTIAALLAACSPRPVPAEPALWEVTAPDGGKAWLFGTVHALDRPVDWRSDAIENALNASDVLLVEVAGLDDSAATGRIFGELAQSEGHPPLSKRIEPALQDDLKEIFRKHGFIEGQFVNTETWAAALVIAQAETKGLESRYGIDRAVVEAAKGKSVAELEGVRGQLSLFDGLPEEEQRDLLGAIVSEARSLSGESGTLVEAWRKGDMAVIERETEKGMLADPELREALFTGRNRAWTERIAQEMSAGHKPFVAVGAAHMAGPEGVPAMLAARGLKVSRIQ